MELICLVLAPIAALFVRSEERTDRVKIMGNQQITMQRDYLRKYVYWFQTHDNAVDEYYYGAFYQESFFRFIRNITQASYDDSKWLRYVCRLAWLWRNIGYGFNTALFAKDFQEIDSEVEKGTKKYTPWSVMRKLQDSWHYKAHVPIGFGRYTSINIGWKAHRGMPRMILANRIIGPIKKFKSSSIS